MFEIPKKIEKFDKYIYEPFCIFEKKNFLEKKYYNELKKTFPVKNLLIKEQKEGLKLSLDNKHSDFFNFIEKNKIWSDFYNLVNSEKFVLRFYYLIEQEILKIEKRKNLKKIAYINYDYKSNFFSKLKKKITNRIFTNLRLGFQFSIIRNNCFIPPHCDTTNKLLSLMIYFPDENPKIDKKIEELGTNFYEKKKIDKSFFDGWDSKLLSEESTKIFFDNYYLFYKSKFESNKLVGFIKNDKSWHDVSPFSFNEPFLRKSLNINLYLV